MVIPNNATLKTTGDDILTKLKGLEGVELEQLFRQLLDKVEYFRSVRQYSDAENRCQRALAWAKDQLWSSRSAPTTDLTYSEGTARAYLGIVFLSQGHLKDAGEHFHEAARIFSQNNRAASAGVAYMALGQTYEFRSDWDNAIAAYQQSLNELNSLSVKTSAGPLKEKVSGLLKDAVQQLDCCPNGGPGIPDAVKVRCIPVIGSVSAGIITPPSQDEFIALDGRHCGEASSAVRVAGDDLIRAGIKDGDYVFIKDKEVGAATDGQLTMLTVTLPSGKTTFFMRYHQEGDHLRLETENDDEQATIVISESHASSRDDIVGRYAARSSRPNVICPTKEEVVEGLLAAVLSIGDR